MITWRRSIERASESDRRSIVSAHGICNAHGILAQGSIVDSATEFYPSRSTTTRRMPVLFSTTSTSTLTYDYYRFYLGDSKYLTYSILAPCNVLCVRVYSRHISRVNSSCRIRVCTVYTPGISRVLYTPLERHLTQLRSEGTQMAHTLI